MMSDKLKPCPFCGSTAQLFGDSKRGEDLTWCVVCQDPEAICCARIPYCNSAEEAVEVWNRRIPDE